MPERSAAGQIRLGARLRRLWRTHGPTFHWRAFRLHGDPPTGRWIPLRVTQVVGGRAWSLAVTRSGPVREPAAEHGAAESVVLDAAMYSVWLHGWRRATEKMTAGQRETAADAVARYNAVLRQMDPDDDPIDQKELRWWR